MTSEARFVCNICGSGSRHHPGGLDRETPSCSSCGSNVRVRGLLRALSLELFGTNLTLPEFPRVKSIRGLGLSDAVPYADTLATCFDYRNTFYDREPHLDIATMDEREAGRYDFVLSSEVFEHVRPPVETALHNTWRLLKDTGVLVFSVPYSLEASTVEHFPALHEFGFAQVGGRLVLVNRTRAGGLQVFEEPVFHANFRGKALEVREFSESGLKALLQEAGFTEMVSYCDDYAPFGIVHTESCSMPMAARKGDFALSREGTREVVEQWAELRQKFDADMRRLGRSYWFRAGRKLGLL